MKDTLKANTYLLNVMPSPPEEREEIENKESYRLILELLYKMHTD